MESVIEEIVASGIPRDQVIKAVEKDNNLFFEDETSIWQYKIIFTMLLEHDIRILSIDLPELPIETFRLFTRFISSSENIDELRIGFENRTSLLSDEEAELLRDAFANNISIKYLTLFKTASSTHQFVDALRANNKIYYLAFIKLFVDKQIALSLKEYLLDTTQLFELKLSGCNFNEESLEVLSDALRNNYSIQKIFIAYETEPYVSDAILEATCQSKLLSTLQLERIPKNINSFLATSHCLDHLTIEKYAILNDIVNVDDIGRLVEGLKQNETLIHLAIMFKSLNSECAIKLSEAWTSDSKIRLRELKLSYNKIAVDGFKVLMTAWKNAPRLSLQKIQAEGNFLLNGDSVNELFFEQWLKESPMIEEFNCSFESADGEWHRHRKLDQIREVNIRRKKFMAKILIIAQTLCFSDFNSLIIEESLILDILYFVQDSYDVDNNPLLNRVQIGRVWQYAKKKPLIVEYNSKDLFIEYVLYGPDNKRES